MIWYVLSGIVDLVGFGQSSSDVVFIGSKASMVDVVLRPSVYTHNSSLTIRTDIIDQHIYIFAKVS